jgi:putative permease
VSLFPSRGWKIVFTVVIVCAVLAFLYSIADIVKLLIVASLLAYILDPVATKLESRGMSRLAATGIIFACVGLVVLEFCLFLVPVIVKQVELLQSPDSTEKIVATVRQIQVLLVDKFAFLGLGGIDLVGKMQNLKIEVTSGLTDSIFAHAISLITDLVAIPFIIFFLLKDGREIKRQLLSVIPNRYFEFTLSLIHKMDLQLGYFLRGQFLDAMIFGILSTIAMAIIGVKNFIFIGAFAGMANLIPYVGPLAGAILATVVTIVNSGELNHVIYVLVAFAIVKIADDSIVQPVVVARSVDMHPLLVLLGVIVGGEFFGILGMLLAVPFMGFVKVVIKESRTMLRRYDFSTG